MLKLNDEQIAYQNQIREFAEKHISPIASEIDREDNFPKGIFEALARMGSLGIMIPKEYGGSGPDFILCALTMEEIAKKSVSVSLSFGQHAVFCSYSLYRLGLERQRGKYLPNLAKGKWMGAWALTEPNAGSDASAIKTRAKRIGSSYILNGSKIFITNGPVADIFLIAAKTREEVGSESNMSIFIVERNTEGLSFGDKMKKCGNRGSPTCEVFLDDCGIPEENLLGGVENRGWQQALSILNVERTVVCFKSLGNAEGALETIIRYTKECHRSGRQLSAYQWVKMKLAEMAVKVEASRLMADRALVEVLEEGNESLKFTSMAKLLCSEVAVQVANDSMEILGIEGYTCKFPIERMLRDAKLGEIGGGTSEIQKIIIGNEILR